MSWPKRYVGYIKDNPEGYWFKRKAYGWGWVPARWQGWASLLACITVFSAFYIPFLRKAADAGLDTSDIVLFLIGIAAWVFLLIMLCYGTGEPPKWQWGIPDNKE